MKSNDLKSIHLESSSKKIIFNSRRNFSNINSCVRLFRWSNNLANTFRAKVVKQHSRQWLQHWRHRSNPSSRRPCQHYYWRWPYRWTRWKYGGTNHLRIGWCRVPGCTCRTRNKNWGEPCQNEAFQIWKLRFSFQFSAWSTQISKKQKGASLVYSPNSGSIPAIFTSPKCNSLAQSYLQPEI